MRDRFPLIALVLASLAVAIGIFASRTAKRGAFADSLSTYRSEPDGARALFLLAQAAGLEVHRRTLDLSHIEETGVMVLLGVEGDKPAPEMKTEDAKSRTLPRGFFVDWMGSEDRKGVMKFVEDGGRLVYVFGSPQHLAEDFGLTISNETSVEERELVPAVPSPLLRGAQQLFARVSGYVSRAKGALTLITDPHADGEAVGVTFELGKGRVLAISAPDLATNRALGRGDNAAFWVSSLRALSHGEPIEFDEYHHGFTGSQSVAAWASRYGLHLAVLQLLAALVALAASTRRFGRPLPPVADSRVLGADYLVAMARIYRQGGHRQHAAKRVMTGLTQDLATRFGLTGRATTADVTRALERQHRGDLAKGFSRVAAEVEAMPASDGDVLRIARRAARLRQGAESAMGGRRRVRSVRR
jgi:hypothetical protein